MDTLHILLIQFIYRPLSLEETGWYKLGAVAVTNEPQHKLLMLHLSMCDSEAGLDLHTCVSRSVCMH